MNRLKRYLLPLLALMISFNASSQKVFFEQLTTAEGLPSDYVNDVFKDSKGFLWIATDKGVCRYDGHSFLYLNKDNGLSSNFVYSITEDLQHNIWFSTFEGGLCKYDGQNISQFSLDPIEFKNVFEILFNADSSVFIVSGREHLFYLQNLSSPPKKFTDYDCIHIFPYERGKFLLLGNDGVFNVVKKENTIAIEEKIWGKRSPADFAFGHSGKAHFAVKIKDSVIFFKGVANKFVTPENFFLPEMAGNLYEGGFITNENEIWMRMKTGLLYKPGDSKPQLYSIDNGLGSNYVRNVYEDDQQNIYVCTFGGGVKIWPGLYIKEFSLKGKVNSIYTDAGATYITTTRGVYKYEQGKNITEYENLRSGNFTSCYRSPDGKFYLGTYNSFLKIPSESFLSSLTATSRKKFEVPLWTGVSGFLSQPDNKLLVSTYGEGIDEYDASNKMVDQLNSNNKRMGSGLVEFLKPLKHSVAALSFNAGMTLTTSDGKTMIISKRDGLLSNSVYSVFQEKENEIWIGTLDGLNLFNGQKIVKTFSYNNGLVGSRVICIFRDSMQRFWILSDKYLHLVEGDQLRPIRSHPLLYSKNSINRAEYDTRNGLLYVGLTDALVVVDMRNIFPDRSVHLPQAVAMLTGNSSLKENDEISSHSSGKIVIHFANQRFPQTKQHDIYYKLKGYDEDWRFLDESSEINYSKLSSGKYELVAKTVNPDFYSSNEVSIVKFETLPPPWKRSWFILCSLVILSLAVFYIGNRSSKKKYDRRIRKMQEQHQLQLERERIARELHDNVGSQLTYLINKIDDEDGVSNKDQAEHLSSFARGAMKELRETIWALDKKEILPEELGNKVRQLLQLYKNNGCTIEMNWQHENGLQRPLNSLEALNIYRIIQEAVNNAVKYSKASAIKIIGDFKGKGFNVSIADNGKGFEVQQKENARLNDSFGQGYGLKNMVKRAEEMNGRLSINSMPGKGTTIELVTK